MKSETVKKILIVIGISGILANSISLTITFIYAYFNGYRVLITINSVGEAHVEFIMLSAISILGIWAWIKVIHNIFKK